MRSIAKAELTPLEMNDTGCTLAPARSTERNCEAGAAKVAGSREVPMRRREFVVNLGLAGAWPLVAQAQQTAPGGAMADSAKPTLKRVRTKTLEIAYEEAGPEGGLPVLMMHGFPYDPRAYDGMVTPLVAAGCRAIVPYLRGYGPTQFLSPQTPRSGQQAALGQDLLDLMDALRLPTALLVGFDWGGRGACVVSALWPERVRGLVTAGGYNIQNIAGSVEPAAPEREHRMWYQYYFHTERGRAGLTKNRDAFCKLLWQLWSPTWKFDDATYQRSAASFHNPDFVDVVIQSYRHRFGYAPGDPDLEGVEQRLAALPPITVPTIAIHGLDDGVGARPNPDGQARFFTGGIEHRMLPGVGHDAPQEAPAAVVEAVLALKAGAVKRG
jgi:pimeloyl-ACP methyl ester carboxylesterase